MLDFLTYDFDVFECVSIELHTLNRKTTIISGIHRLHDGKTDDSIRKMDFVKKFFYI